MHVILLSLEFHTWTQNSLLVWYHSISYAAGTIPKLKVHYLFRIITFVMRLVQWNFHYYFNNVFTTEYCTQMAGFGVKRLHRINQTTRLLRTFFIQHRNSLSFLTIPLLKLSFLVRIFEIVCHLCVAKAASHYPDITLKCMDNDRDLCKLN